MPRILRLVSLQVLKIYQSKIFKVDLAILILLPLSAPPWK